MSLLFGRSSVFGAQPASQRLELCEEILGVDENDAHACRQTAARPGLEHLHDLGATLERALGRAESERDRFTGRCRALGLDEESAEPDVLIPQAEETLRLREVDFERRLARCRLGSVRCDRPGPDGKAAGPLATDRRLPSFRSSPTSSSTRRKRTPMPPGLTFCRSLGTWSERATTPSRR